ncbi:two-component regulator propeller domain-containing protein [Shewanella woodyi]|uniref:two-component regulator propeller domain-containing protein n=1 Tax=Shewanella woodyi TaxID=60961 RepID=UPI0007F8AC13|nr:two-component regulator propeller domain-containing protein [Shewanella woodyi]
MRIFILSVIWLIGCPLFAMENQPIFDAYKAEQGLSMNTVNDIVTDDQGFLWIATQAGLNRYDGKHFKLYQAGDHKGPTEKHIQKLFFGRKKQLWLLTKSDGLNLYQANTDTFIPFNESNSPLSNTGIIDLYQDSRGILWLATHDNGLIQYSPTENRILHHFLSSPNNKGLISNRLNLIFGDQFDRIWLVSDKGLSLIEPDNEIINFPQINSELGDSISSLEIGKSNTLWIGTKERGMYLFDIQTGTLKPITAASQLENDTVTHLKKDKFGKLWIAVHGKGLARYSPQSNKLLYFDSAAEDKHSLNSVHVTSFAIDSEHQLWVGTRGGGLNKTYLEAESFGHISTGNFKDHPLENSNIRSIFRDHQQQLWIGTAAGLFQAHEDINREITGFSLFEVAGIQITDLFISFIREDEQKRFWVGTRGKGLFIFSPDKQSYTRYQYQVGNHNGLPSNYLYSLYFDDESRAWISTKDSGVARYIDEEQGFIQYKHDRNDPNSLSSNEITNLVQDSEGNFWFTSYDKGLSRLDKQGKFTHFNTQTESSIPNKHLMSIHQGGGDNLWISTNDGIFSFNTKSYETKLFSTDNGLIGNVAYLTLMDNKKNLWIGTASGLSMLNTHNLSIRNFTYIDGLQDNEFNFGAGFIDTDNRIYLGGINGFNHFFTSQLPKLSPPRQPLLETLTILNGSQSSISETQKVNITQEDKIKLSYQHDIFTLSFLTPALHRAKRLVYEYKMLGLHDSWLVANTDQTAQFTGLSSGNYAFLLRAKDIDGKYSPIRRLDIQVLAAPWLSWWAITLYVVAFITLFSLLYYSKLKKYNEQNLLLKEIEQSEQRLQLSLWGSGDEFWDWNIVDKQVVRTNVFLQYPDKEFHLHDTMQQCVHPDDLPNIMTEIDACMKKGKDKFELTYRSKLADGGWLWVLNRGQVILRDQLARPSRLAGTIKNIQSQKETETALRTLNQDLEKRVFSRTSELQKSNDELTETLEELKFTQGELIDKEKMATLGGLVASITHEINTPIGISVTAASHLHNSVEIFNQHYNEGEISQEEFEDYQIEVSDCSKLILTNLERASKLIQSFKKVSVDQSHEDVREFDLKSYLDEIFLSLNPMLSRTAHQYSYQCKDSIVIKSNPGAFYQIISNLINNSIVHAFPDGRSGELNLTVTCSNSGIEIIYQDNGCGMPEHVQEKIFSPFFTTKRGKGGSGLGMNIVYNLVTQVLEGEVELTSTIDNGSLFKISLPSSLLINSA